MAIHYHVDIARHVSGADFKWIDNLLTRYQVPGTEGRRQGVARRVSPTGICHIVLTWRLCCDLGVSSGVALNLATRLLESNDPLFISNVIELRFDRDRFTSDIERSLDHAVEAIVPARRGRPPRTIAQ